MWLVLLVSDQGSSFVCPLSAGILDACCCSWVFMWVPGNQTQILMLKQQAHDGPLSPALALLMTPQSLRTCLGLD